MPLDTYETWEAQLPLLNRAWEKVQTAYGEQRYNIIEDALRLSAPNVVKRQKRRRLPRKHQWPLLERGRRCFLDVGGWHGKPDGIARTDFGLVSGQTVLLCSWLNMEGEVRGRKQYDWYCRKNRVHFSQKISDFFDIQKGAILEHFEFSEPMINGDELIIFLPDLHLHLCKATVIDNFKYNRNFETKKEKSEIVSLEDELAALLKHGQSLNAEIIQVGDCFEVWEVQAHLVEDYECLDKYRKTGVIRGMQIRQPTLQDICNKMWKERKIMPRDDYQWEMRDIQHQARAAEAFGVSKPLTYEHVNLLGVPVDDTYTVPSDRSQADEVVLRTMMKYPKIFANEELNTNEQNMPFLWLRGNHDNMRTNYYYEKVEEKDYKFLCSRIIKQACTPPEVLDAYDIYRGGIDRCIWAEHGHRLDSANADSIFDFNRKGYYWTKFFTAGLLSKTIGEAGWRQGAIELAVQEITERYGFYMRGDQLNLLYDIFKNYEEVRLVVMGHTHTPALVDWGIFLRWILCRTYYITCPK